MPRPADEHRRPTALWSMILGGALVDRALRTSDPDVYAVGDIANHDHPALGHRIRVEHWATALNQPAVPFARL